MGNGSGIVNKWDDGIGDDVGSTAALLAVAMFVFLNKAKVRE
jgi:hypothetical protein